MDQPNSDRLPEIVEYFRANPTPPAGGQHVHIHHHYAPAPAPPPAPERDGPSFAEKALPWVWLALGSTIILTICALLLAVAMMALLMGLIGLTLFAVALAFLIKTAREAQINAGLAEAAARDRGKRTR
jgi:hypothetical protein